MGVLAFFKVLGDDFGCSPISCCVKMSAPNLLAIVLHWGKSAWGINIYPPPYPDLIERGIS